MTPSNSTALKCTLYKEEASLNPFSVDVLDATYTVNTLVVCMAHDETNLVSPLHERVET